MSQNTDISVTSNEFIQNCLNLFSNNTTMSTNNIAEIYKNPCLYKILHNKCNIYLDIQTRIQFFKILSQKLGTDGLTTFNIDTQSAIQLLVDKQNNCAKLIPMLKDLYDLSKYLSADESVTNEIPINLIADVLNYWNSLNNQSNQVSINFVAFAPVMTQMLENHHNYLRLLNVVIKNVNILQGIYIYCYKLYICFHYNYTYTS